MKKKNAIRNNNLSTFRKAIIASVQIILLLLMGLLIYSVCAVVAKSATTEIEAAVPDRVFLLQQSFERAWDDNVINSPIIIEETTTEATTEVTTTTTETETEQTTQSSAPSTQYLGNFRISHYCPCSICNGGYTGTALGTQVTPYRTIAVDRNIIPLGSRVMINGNIYVAEDTGGAIKGNRIDLCVSTHDEAYSKGIIYADAYLVQ